MDTTTDLEREYDPEGVFLNIQHMSRTVQRIINDVIGTMNP